MHLAIIGSGYVGLVSGACFADFGHRVSCVDKDPAKIAALQRNEIPLYEPGLEQMVQTNAREGRLDFTTDLEKSVNGADDGHGQPRNRRFTQHLSARRNDRARVRLPQCWPLESHKRASDLGRAPSGKRSRIQDLMIETSLSRSRA